MYSLSDTFVTLCVQPVASPANALPQISTVPVTAAFSATAADWSSSEGFRAFTSAEIMSSVMFPVV